jgi:hypothetical protein
MVSVKLFLEINNVVFITCWKERKVIVCKLEEGGGKKHLLIFCLRKYIFLIRLQVSLLITSYYLFVRYFENALSHAEVALLLVVM